ncbi:type II secretion system F family protein [Streptomyces sp. NPDC047000]|uniref:type II secretion system F family protein n=1 Tax=Streptomyces sp. NPDC047000 TaxID=3155474 RepID=UPI0033CDB923
MNPRLVQSLLTLLAFTAGAAAGVLVLLGALARWARAVRHGRRARRRLDRLLPGTPGKAPERPRLRADAAVRRWLPLAGAAGAGWMLAGGVTGTVVGLAAAAGVWWWGRKKRASGSGETYDVTEAVRQLPLAADLLAACIAAGAGPVTAARAVGEALGGPVGDGLACGAAEVRLGGEPADAWRRLAALPGSAAALARLLERADESGLPAAVPVARLAADARTERARAATARARRAAVLITAPVGLCFLPAFIAVGVVPVVIGLAGGVLGGGG